MTMPIYNVDKPFEFDRLLVLEISNPLFLYAELYDSDNSVGLSATKPEFLARFRKCLYDGTVSKNKYATPFQVPQGSKVIIKTDGTTGIMLSTGKYLEFSKSPSERLLEAELGDKDFGSFGSFISMTMDNFEKFLDSYKLDKPVSPRPRGQRKAVPADNYLSDDDKELLMSGT